MIKVFDTEDDAVKWILDNSLNLNDYRIRYVDDDNWGVKGYVIIEDVI